MGVFRTMGSLGGAALILSGCALQPREFQPQLVGAPADPPAFQAALAECRTRALAAAKGGGVAGAAAKGAAASYVTGAILMNGAGESLVATAAASSVAVVAMPVVGVAVAVGASRRARSRKEARINAFAGECLAGKGYQVETWRRN